MHTGLFALVIMNELHDTDEASNGITFGVGSYTFTDNLRVDNNHQRIKPKATYNDNLNILRKHVPCDDNNDVANNAVSNENDEIYDELAGTNRTPCTCEQVCDITNYCVTCGDIICTLCEKDHALRKHTLVRNSWSTTHSNTEICPKHKHYYLDMFCLMCGKYMCVVCKLLAHVKHDFLDMSSDECDAIPVVEEIDDNLRDKLKDDVKVAIATGVEWTICTITENTTTRYWNIPCCSV